MSLQSVFDKISSDLPWVDHHRLLVGDLSSRETVKDILLKKNSTIPSYAVSQISDFAAEIIKACGQKADENLNLYSRIDALQMISTQSDVPDEIKSFVKFFKRRPIAKKIERILTSIDRNVENLAQVEVIEDFYESEKDPRIAKFISYINETHWKRDNLWPWSEAHILRSVIELIQADDNARRFLSGKTIWLWAFGEDFTVLENKFLELCKQYARVEMLDSTELTHETIDHWLPHSVWDEIEFLISELKKCSADDLDDIAVFIPEDSLYKRLIRARLEQENIPLRDRSLTDAWKENSLWLWSIDLLNFVSRPPTIEKLRELNVNFDLIQLAMNVGWFSGASQFFKLEKNKNFSSISEASKLQFKTLKDGFLIFSKAKSIKTFSHDLSEWIFLIDSIFGVKLHDIINEFIADIGDEKSRPQLRTFLGKASSYINFLEEFYDKKARSLGLRCRHGVYFVGHENWIPVHCKKAYVLGANLCNFKKISNPNDIEANEILKIIRKIDSSNLSDVKLLSIKNGVFNHKKIIISEPQYSHKGEMLLKSPFFKKITDDLSLSIEVKKSGAAINSGWVTHPQESNKKLEVAEPEMIKTFLENSPLRISAFEDYLKCPFIFYARHLLKLDREPKLGLDLPPQNLGQLVHKVVERMIKSEIDNLGSVFSSLEGAKSVLDETLSSELSQLKYFKGVYSNLNLKNSIKIKIYNRLVKWLEFEIENKKNYPTLKPIFVELPIEYELATKVDGIVKKVKLVGKVDRVDTFTLGDNDLPYAVIIDYKSGSNDYIGRELIEASGAQILMYLSAITKDHKFKPAAAYYLNLFKEVSPKAGVFPKEYQKIIYKVASSNSGYLKERSINDVLEYANTIWAQKLEQLLIGNFTPSPSRKDKDCLKCSFIGICGFNIKNESLSVPND